MKPHYTNTNNPIDFPKSENKMNERIRELMEKSMESTGVEGLGGSYQELNPVKFAQLIIRECAEIARHHVMNIADYRDAHFVENRIKEHFGVEE